MSQRGDLQSRKQLPRRLLKQARRLLLVAIIPLVAGSAVAKEITIAVMLSPQQRGSYYKLFKGFQKETGIKVNTIVLPDALYKKQLPIWLLEGEGSPDVLYWQGSRRLFLYAQKGVVHPITQLWEKSGWDQHFSHVKSSISYEGEIYALPYSYYHWGLFYNKKLMAQYGTPPQKWSEFLALCQKMKEDGLIPLAIGTKNPWPAAAWFDYLNLRINGLDFHRQALAGEISFYDLRLQRVFITWKRLIDNDYFNRSSELVDWDEMLGHVYRGKAGFMLMGNFISSFMADRAKESVGFTPFPQIEEIPRYEDAPIEAFMISRHSKQIAESEKFLEYISRADVQSKFNQEVDHLPPNSASKVGTDRFTQYGFEVLNSAAGYAEYFDRDTHPDFEQRAVKIFAEFISSGNLEKTLSELEQARKDVFKKSE